jgi:hypothetical protein
MLLLSLRLIALLLLISLASFTNLSSPICLCGKRAAIAAISVGRLQGQLLPIWRRVATIIIVNHVSGALNFDFLEDSCAKTYRHICFGYCDLRS